MKKQMLRNFFRSLTLACCALPWLALPAAHAQAPVSVVGDTFGAGITNGTAPFESSGLSYFFAADSGTNFQLVNIYGITAGTGTYSYVASNDTAAVTLDITGQGVSTGEFDFTNATSGNYVLNAGGGFQDANFLFFSGNAPSSIVAHNFYGKVRNGLAPFASNGVFVLKIPASGNSYTIEGTGVVNTNSSGTYSYSKVNNSAGKLQLTDSVFGSRTMYLTYSGVNTNNGGYAIVQAPAGGYQIGGFDEVETTPPVCKITEPTAGLSVSNANYTVMGTASDNVAVNYVFCQVNGGLWELATTSNGWTNWTFDATLTPGTNVINAYAVDTSTNNSTVATVSFVYVPSAVLTVTTEGEGTVSPNLNGALLEIGKSYTMKAAAATGFKFVNWTGSTNSTNATLVFTMEPGLDYQANFMDSTPPTLAITAPKSGQDVSNADFTVTGTAKDNVGVASVFCQLNGGDWTPATSANGWTNWTFDATLTAGTNVIKAYAVDGAGNNSAIESVSFVYVVSAVLTVTTSGNGTVSPNLNGALLEIGKSYTMKAAAATGFKFTGWTGSTNSTNATLVFTMEPGLDYTANFQDATPPTLAITAPKSGQNVSNADFTVTGTAKDNVGVSNVYWQLNGGSWTPATSANNWTNWSAGVTLTAGTNVVKAYAADAAGNNSATQSVTFVYVVSAVLTVTTEGEGTISPNLNGALLEIGKSYTMKAAAATGFKFTGWTGSTNSTNATLVFTMEPGLVYTANFADATPPTLTITAPTSNQNVSNADFTVTGTAKDNVSVASVFYQLNGGSWTPAMTANDWANWSAGVTLTAGTNVIKAYAVDGAGNNSAIESVSFVYVVSAVLTVTTSGNGTVSPNLNGALLEIGKSYTMKAAAATGFKFTGWTGSTNSTNATLVFTMEPGLDYTANFADATPPTLAITAPKSGQNVSNADFTVTGTAGDNVGVVSVFCQVNGGEWQLAMTANGWSNWMAVVTLTPGTNTVRAYSADAAGNDSTIASVAFNYVAPPDWAPTSLSGLMAEVTSGTNAPFSIAFGDSTFGQAATDTNNIGGVGNYTYAQTTTNTGQLTLVYTQPPPSVGGTNLIDFTFTNVDSGTFTNVGGGDSGTISLSVASDLALASLSGTTLHATNTVEASGVVISLGAGTAFSQTETGGKVSSGTYSYAKYSPLAGMLVLSYTSPTNKDGAITYAELTFTGNKVGDYFVTSYDNMENFDGYDDGTFNIQ